MNIELTEEQISLLAWKAVQTGSTSEELLDREIARHTDQYADERKAEFLNSAETRARIEKLQTADPAKLAELDAALDAAQK